MDQLEIVKTRRKRNTMDKYHICEREKAKLANFPPKKYERELKKLIKRLEI